MYELQIVPDRPITEEFSPRVSTVTESTGTATDGNTLYITTDKDVTTRHTATIEITPQVFHTVPASLSYELTAPLYATMIEKYQQLIADCDDRINQLKEKYTDLWSDWRTTEFITPDTGQSFAEFTEEWRISQDFGDLYNSEAEKARLEAEKLEKERFDAEQEQDTNFLQELDNEERARLEEERKAEEEYIKEMIKEDKAYLDAVKEHYADELREWTTASDEFNKTFGYGVLFILKTDNFGCDVKYVRLNSSRGVLMTISVLPTYTTARPMPYDVYLETKGVDEFLIEKDSYVDTVFNNNYLSNQIFQVIDTIKVPNVTYWVEISADGESWLKTMSTDLQYSARKVELNGCLYGTIASLTPITDPERDRVAVVVQDASGVEYTGEMMDYSSLSVGDTVLLTKDGNELTMTVDQQKVKIKNSEGTSSSSHSAVSWSALE